jgi:hypothetical protein
MDGTCKCTWEMRNKRNILFENLKARDTLEDVRINGRIGPHIKIHM